MIYRAVDVLGFAGGFTLGVVQSGFTLVGKRELPGAFGVANCEVNRHLLGDAWSTEVGEPETWTIPPGGVDLVFGNPPCSAWSVMSSKDFRGAESKILGCTWAFVNYVARVRPYVAVFESVQQAFTKPDGRALMTHLRDHLETQTGDRWTLYHVRHNAYELGGAAERRRYFWVASRIPFGIEPPQLGRRPVLTEVLNDLDGLANTWQAQPYRRPPTWWTKTRRSDTGLVDGHSTHDTPLTRRVFDLIQSVGWRPGESISQVARRCWEQTGSLPPSFASTQAKIVDKNFMMGFTTPVRWRGNAPGRVITGGSLVMVIHPTADRMITHREAARILGFPDDWRLLPLRGSSGLQMTHGKGITVDCGRWIGSWVRRALDGSPGTYVGVSVGDREFDVDVTYPARTHRLRPGKVVITEMKNRENA